MRLVLISHCIVAYNRRVRGDPYYELMDEFLTAVKRRYGNTVLLQFEGMAYENASRLLNMYRWGLGDVWGPGEGTGRGVWAGAGFLLICSMPFCMGDSGQAAAGVTSDRQTWE